MITYEHMEHMESTAMLAANFTAIHPIIFQDISLKTKDVNLILALEEKPGDHQERFRFTLWPLT